MAKRNNGVSVADSAAVRFFAWSIGLFLFEWWVIAKCDGQLLAAAAIFAIFTAGAVLWLGSVLCPDFRVRSGWVWIVLRRLPGNVLRDGGLLAVRLMRAVFSRDARSGIFRDVEIEAGPAEPFGRGRRALVLTAVSVAPNAVAMAIAVAASKGTRSDRLLVHQLVTDSSSFKDKEWPV